MMAIVVRLTPGEPRPAWCDRCLTGAATEVDLLSITEHGVSVIATVRVCARCDTPA